VSEAGHVIGVDLGGTKIAAGVVDGQLRVVRRARTATPTQGPDAVIAAIVGVIRELEQGEVAVGVGAPGPVHDGIVMAAPNLAGWTAPVPLADRLGAALGVRVTVDNDATAGAVGEWTAGAGRGARNLLGVWLGTGVGGGLVLDGVPFSGSAGGAGELGHVVVQPGGAVCGCGRRGCLEAYAGRAAMEGAVRARVAAGEQTVLTAIMAEKGRTRMTSGVWAKALERGDAMAGELLEAAVAALGVAVGSAINLLDLDTVVVGGGVADKLGDDLLVRIAAAAEPVLLVPAAPRRWVLAELGDDSGIIGAAWRAADRGQA
jgi:glucokinase